MNTITAIGAGLGLGAQIYETAYGPKALRESRKLEAVCQEAGLNLNWGELLESPFIEGKPSERWPLVQAFNERLQSVVKETCMLGEQPLIIGGDHAIAMGTWPGVIEGCRLDGQRFGLLWVDAHMDAHTPETSPSGAIHGMPVAGLLGKGEAAWGDTLKPWIRPEDIALLGIRSYESGEADLLASLGVRVYDMQEIQEKGFKHCFQEALGHIQESTACFGVTVDLDAFDPSVAPGVGSPEGAGLFPEDVLPCMKMLREHPECVALEIAEFNPHRDRAGQTEALIGSLVTARYASEAD